MKRHSQLYSEPSQCCRNQSNHDFKKRPKVGNKEPNLRWVCQKSRRSYAFQPCLRRVQNNLCPPHLMLRVDFATTEPAFTLLRALIHTWTRVSRLNGSPGSPRTINTGSLGSEPGSFSSIPIPTFARRSNYHIWQICSRLQPPVLHMGSSGETPPALYFWGC